MEGGMNKGIKAEMGRGRERYMKEPGARRFQVGRCHGGGLAWSASSQTHLSLDGEMPGTQVPFELSHCLVGGVAFFT